MPPFNEDSRVKIPALLHLTRLGWRYLSLKGVHWDACNNIFPGIFESALLRINPGLKSEDVPRLLNAINLDLQNEDLGRAFHKQLTARSGVRLFDFDNLDNNSFHVVTELPFENGDDNFRPDITLLVNGLPLAFIEVKKRMNPGGVLEERARMNRRHANPKFRRFFNLVQLMVFSNNMEYDDGQFEPVQGAFYAASTYGEAHFNYFREERSAELAPMAGPPDDAIEDSILTDTNLASIKGTPEFERNKSPDSPTNRLLTSLFSRGRLAFIVQYAFAWLDTEGGIYKHVMRYPQMFATMAIADRLAAGVRKDIIWHTQGSGKTALAYYNVRFLTDWFQQRGQVVRFYFIVDRLDLLKQARDEFTLRGLSVHVIDSREAFARDIRQNVTSRNDRGAQEITVVIRETLFEYSLDDAELFSQQVGQIGDIGKLRAIVKALGTARELYNLIRLGGHDELADLLDFRKLRLLHNEARNALAALNLKQEIENAQDTSGLLNQALEDVIFKFEKVGEA